MKFPNFIIFFSNFKNFYYKYFNHWGFKYKFKQIIEIFITVYLKILIKITEFDYLFIPEILDRKYPINVKKLQYFR